MPYAQICSFDLRFIGRRRQTGENLALVVYGAEKISVSLWIKEIVLEGFINGRTNWRFIIREMGWGPKWKKENMMKLILVMLFQNDSVIKLEKNMVKNMCTIKIILQCRNFILQSESDVLLLKLTQFLLAALPTGLSG